MLKAIAMKECLDFEWHVAIELRRSAANLARERLQLMGRMDLRREKRVFDFSHKLEHGMPRRCLEVHPWTGP